MTEANRVSPLGVIGPIDQRGTFMGNRGSIHRDRQIVRSWQVRRWIICVLSYKGWVAPKWQPGRWTPLFFWDEAVALAAGHRPCALCRHEAFVRWGDAWESATGERPKVDAMDRALHDERVTGRASALHTRSWRALPEGTFVVVDGEPALVLADRLVPWRPQPAGYARPIARPAGGTAEVLTPPSTVAVLAHGYSPVLHPTTPTA